MRRSLDGFAAEHVVAVLKSTEFRLVTCTSWSGFRRHAAATHAAVIVAPRLDLDRTRESLCDPSHEDFPCPLVLVTIGDRENLRQLGRVRVTDVVFLDEVSRRLARVLTSVALSDGRLMLRAAVLRREMHPTLTLALRTLLELPLLEPAQNLGPDGRFPRTVEDVARLADVSADYLRHLATQARLPFGRVLHRYAALQALESLAAGVPARVVAAYFGYRDISGVDKLVMRNLGGRLGNLVQTDLQPHYARTARLVETRAPAVARPSA